MNTENIDKLIRLGREKLSEILRVGYSYGYFACSNDQIEYLLKTGQTITAEEFEIINDIIQTFNNKSIIKISIIDKTSSIVVVNIQKYEFNKNMCCRFQKDTVSYQLFLIIMSSFEFNEEDLNKKLKTDKSEEVKPNEPEKVRSDKSTAVTNDEIYNSLAVIKSLCSTVTCKDCPLGYNDGINDVCKLKDEKAPYEWSLIPPGPWKAF